MRGGEHLSKKARSLSPVKPLGKQEQAQVILELRNQHQYLNHKTVQRLMGQLGLKSTVRPKRYQSYKGSVGKAAPNLLERNFIAKAPNQKWVTDVTEFNIKGERVYLSPILNLYNQEIVSYEIADRPQISMVSTMLNKAFKHLQQTEKPILHSDQGWQYQIGLYQQALHKQGITQSMSRKGNCLDNAVMENWFGMMKSSSSIKRSLMMSGHLKGSLRNISITTTMIESNKS